MSRKNKKGNNKSKKYRKNDRKKDIKFAREIKKDPGNELEKKIQGNIHERVLLKEKILNHIIKNWKIKVVALAGILFCVIILFIIFTQFNGKDGYIEKKIDSIDMVKIGQKTWVGYEQPIVNMTILTSSDCDERCNPEEVLVWLRRMIPTLRTEKIDITSPQGKNLIETAHIKTLPAYIFEQPVSQTTFFKETEELFKKRDLYYILDGVIFGLVVEKYLTQPEVTVDMITQGTSETPHVEIIEYYDYTCIGCKKNNDHLNKLLKTYSRDIKIIYKHFVPDRGSQAQNAAIAVECANQQGKFVALNDLLFARQNMWIGTEGLDIFKAYAKTVKIDSKQFNSCIEGGNFLERIQRDTEEAQNFAINHVPAYFIDKKYYEGVIEYDDLKKIIDQAILDKKSKTL